MVAVMSLVTVASPELELLVHLKTQTSMMLLIMFLVVILLFNLVFIAVLISVRYVENAGCMGRGGCLSPTFLKAAHDFIMRPRVIILRVQDIRTLTVSAFFEASIAAAESASEGWR